MTEGVVSAERTPAKAWRMLALGVAAQASGSFLISIPVYLIPLLHLQQGVPLTSAGALAAAPTIGTVLTLVAWGAAADRFGERGVIALGQVLAATIAFATAFLVGDLVGAALLLGLGGAAAASASAASGRVVIGWFPRRRRGFAMGVRQISQPLGVAIAALVVPPLAAGAGLAAPFVVAGVVLAFLGIACALGIRNPPRSPVGLSDGAAANPYRRDGFLVRIHIVSALLVVPQFTLSTFGMLWLITGLGWSETTAGIVVGSAQLVGALGRIAVGDLSDRVGSRVRVLRWVALAGIATMLALALTGAAQWAIPGAILLVIATTVSVADNGLAFTSVAEAAGSAWAGRALGIQNTGQFLAASAVGPGMGALITLVGFPLSFAIAALAPVASFPLIPRRDQDRR
ncbi:MFS transporter [Microbacterium sp. X-17]|uniref:MFS transporter n=1 Tax=Microbacterium sp. X-17 TaxID=3144404 RepID=UPI0031F4BCB8